MTGSFFRSVGAATAGGLAGLRPEEVAGLPDVGLPEAVGLPAVVDVSDDGVLDPQAANRRPPTTTAGTRDLRTAGTLPTARRGTSTGSALGSHAGLRVQAGRMCPGRAGRLRTNGWARVQGHARTLRPWAARRCARASPATS